MKDVISDMQWADFTRYPFDVTDQAATFPVPVRKGIVPLGSHVVELSLNRRIHYFERNPEHMMDWMQDTADHLATLYLPETFPKAVTMYTAREVGGFAWEQAGFTVTPDVPVRVIDLSKPVAFEPLSDDPAAPNKVVLAAISSIDLLESCGYVVE